MRLRGTARDWMRARFMGLVAFLCCGLGVVVFQAYRIQILHGDKLRAEIQKIYQREVTVVPARGSIYDRNGEDLAISIPVDSVYARPGRIEDPVGTAKRLSAILELDYETILRKLKQDAPFVWLKRQVVPLVGSRVRSLGLPGIGVVQETRRFYPNLELASHLLGFVGVDGQGLEGIEFQYDGLLKGETSRLIVDHDALGRPLGAAEGVVVARRDGKNLVLTIHKEIQYIAEQRLLEGVEAAKAKGGMTIVMDPRTGEILAMANVPTFNPNTYKQYPEGTLKNRCITDSYEPGSAFKPFIVAGAIEEKAFRPSDPIYCESGAYRIHDKVIRDIHRYGTLPLSGVIQKSSNIGAAKIGLSMGAERVYSYIRRFGFGRPTGVDLPGEASGLLRPPKWAPIELATISFGQGVSVTALQLATAFSALANGGRIMRPYVVKEILDAQGNTVERRTPQQVGQAISPTTAAEVTKILVSVVSSEGTGSQAAVEGFKIAGKTGTAQKPDLRNGGYMKGKYVASFVGFAPANDPRLCVLVAVDEPQGNIYGGQTAAPIFREILKDAMGILGIYPEERLLAQGKNGSAGGGAL